MEFIILAKLKNSISARLDLIKLFLLYNIFHFSIALDLSLPPLQKCAMNRLAETTTELEIPAHLMSTNDPFKFRLQEKCATRLPHCMKPCPSPMTQLPIPLTPRQPHLSENNSSETELEDSDDFISLFLHFTPKGYFRFAYEYFSPDDFCLYSHQDEQLVIKICPSKCASDVDGSYSITTKMKDDDPSSSVNSFEVCVPKCCSIHKVVDLQTGGCEYSDTDIPWVPLVYRSPSRQICGEKRTNLKLHYIQSPPTCINFNMYFLKPIHTSTRVRFRLLTNGSVLLRELTASKWVMLEKGTYCMDGMQNYGDDPKLYSGNPMDQVLFHCINASEKVETEIIGRPSKEDRLTFSGIAYIILLFSGIPFLLITVIIYVVVWSKQNVHGWTQFSHTLAVLLHYFCIAVANTVTRIFNSDHNASSMCKIVGISNHFFVLASFCWLTVINYDLFSMFRHLKTTVGRSRGLKRFLAYMAIAWGFPFVAVMISVILDNLYGLYGDDGECEVDVIVPLYGHRSCYMVHEAQPYYLFYPVGILMIGNVILAGMTFVNMFKHDQSAKMATAESRTKHRRKFSVLAKLFVVMGLVWVFEMFVWLFIKEGETLPWYLVFPDVFNLFQAIAIFSLFACQPKILNQVADSYPKLKVITEALKKLSCNNNGGNNKQKSTTLTQTANNNANSNSANSKNSPVKGNEQVKHAGTENA